MPRFDERNHQDKIASVEKLVHKGQAYLMYLDANNRLMAMIGRSFSWVKQCYQK